MSVPSNPSSPPSKQGRSRRGRAVALAAGVSAIGALALTGATAGAAPGPQGPPPPGPQGPPPPGGPNTLTPFKAQTIASISAPNGDNNPYGLAIVPVGSGKLSAGNLLVTDFNNSGGAAGGGSSILQVDPNTGVVSTFTSGSPISGPVGVAINPINDGVWIGDFGSTDGSTSNDLLILADGSLKANFNAQSTSTTVTSGDQPTFNGVWGQGVSDVSGRVSFYYGTTGSGSAGTGGGEVWRIDPHPTGLVNGQPVHSTYVEVASGLGDNATSSTLPVNAANAAGPQGFAYDAASGVLYVSDDANNTIYALPGAATATAPVTPQIVASGGAINVPENIAIDPANGDLLVANAGDNTLTEIDPSTGAVVGSRVLDNGAAGALFGLVATTGTNGRVDIYYVDDNTNTLQELISPPQPPKKPVALPADPGPAGPSYSGPAQG